MQKIDVQRYLTVSMYHDNKSLNTEWLTKQWIYNRCKNYNENRWSIWLESVPHWKGYLILPDAKKVKLWRMGRPTLEECEARDKAMRERHEAEGKDYSIWNYWKIKSKGSDPSKVYSI